MTTEESTNETIKETATPQKAPVKNGASKKPKSSGSHYRTILLSLISVATIFSIGAFIISAYLLFNRGAAHISTTTSNGNSINFKEGSIAEIANKVSPAVVSIVTETRTFSYFGQDSTSTAAGTGMIITADGYVLTNKHVIDGASDVQIILDNGTKYTDVKLVSADPLNDVAYLKIENASGLPTVSLGDSKTISTGQQVIAIGNALGQYQNTVTEGVISGTGRTITAADSSSSSYETLNDMIQTDASINAGNSGGPLVNAAGEVIGINTAVSSGNGIGFAIPISSIKGMLKNIVENGKTERAFLGIVYINITPDIASNYKLETNAGAYVFTKDSDSAVISGSPAEKAGIKDGDIITAIGNFEVGKNGTVSSLLGEYTIGDTIELTILRDGKQLKLSVTLEAYPESLNKS